MVREFLFCALVHFVLPSLAGCSLGKFADDYPLGAPEAGETFSGMRQEIIFSNCRAARQFDKGTGHVYPFFIGHRHDSRKAYCRVRVGRFFHLDGRDVLAA